MPVDLNTLRYEAGADRTFDHRLTFDLWQAKFSVSKSDMVTRFIEFWCQKNCRNGWRVEQKSRDLNIWFESPRDFVLFKISYEYSIF